MSADYHVHGSIAVIALNNPPVNGLGLATRTAAAQGVECANADPAVRAIVISGAGKAFSGGADIREFNSPLALTEPSLHTLIRVVEGSSKPVVAAIHSVCMGGGLELALGCNYRVAMPGAQIALPEVKLGLLPGAGGTQRLPRVLDLERAIGMIVGGAPVLSEKLAGTALFDQVFAADTDLLPAAIAFAEGIADLRPLPTVRERQVQHPDPVACLREARARVDASAGPFPAPRACVEAIAAAVQASSFEDGLAFERARFMQLTTTPESKALRHAFFAERAAGKVPGLGPDVRPRTIAGAAVVGAGTMGAGIALNFAQAGIPVTILEMKQDALERGMAAIRAILDASVAKGRLTGDAARQRLALLQGTLSYDAIKDADIVVEAVFEDMEVKELVFRELDQVMKPGAILASNTSTLDLNRIAGFTRRPQDVVGLHFFSPAHVMKLLEIVRGERTAPEVLATALALAKRLKKLGVVAGVCDGFIGNRMVEHYLRQAVNLLEEGALPQQVDRAIEAFGFAMGPFRMSDLAGNDIGWHIRKRRRVEMPGFVYSALPDLLCERRRFGQKAGAGWYDYAAGSRQATPSTEVELMIVQHSSDLGQARREIDDTEIVERLVYALVNEGANILDEGIALRASDIDMVYLSGYGFPLQHGGPMFYADTVGLDRVLAGIEGFARARQGKEWSAAPLLRRLAAEGKTFNA